MTISKDVFIPSSPTNRKDGIWVRFDENGNLRFRIIQRIQSTKISHDRQHSRHCESGWKIHHFPAESIKQYN